MNPDCFTQYTQAISGKYNDWHPVIHTLLVFRLPLLLTGGWINSVSIFQITVFGLVFGYALITVKKHTSTKYAVLSLLYVMLNPHTTNLALFPFKDIAFGIGALLMVTYALNIYFSNGEWIKKPINTILFIAAASLTTLFRHNALLFTIPLIIAVIILINKKRALIICLSIIVVILGIKYPLYSALNVTDPDKREMEVLGLPLNIIGAAVTYSPEKVDEDTLEFAYKFAPEELWKKKYSYGSLNHVKWHEETNQDVIEEYGAGKIVYMSLKCIEHCPVSSLKSVIKLTDVVYTVCDDYRYYRLPGISENDYGISPQGIPSLKWIDSKITKISMLLFPWLFLYVGSMHLILIIAVLAKCKLHKPDHWKRIMFILPVFFYNYSTALLLTSAADSVRFLHYTFILMPLLLVFLFRTEKKPSTE